MEKDAYQKTYDLENWYWWYLGRRVVMRSLLDYFLQRKNMKISDIGCGTGGNLAMLREFGEVMGLDRAPEALEFCKAKGFDNVQLMANEYHTGLQSESQDLVSLFDVLEHFDDDGRALKEIWRILKPHGFLMLTVPAFNFLWSELDEELHHFRRYRVSELKKLLEANNFKVIKISYLFFFVFPLIVLYRVIGRFSERSLHPQFSYVELPKPINSFLVFLSRIESVFLKFINLPVGSSVIVLAQKKNTP